MNSPCPLCGDLGMLLTERPDGSRSARVCDCRVERRRLRTLAQAAIPVLYSSSTLDNFFVDPHSEDQSLARARFQARKFVQSYPGTNPGTGLLLTGSVGTGKTHLAVAILRALVETRGVQGMFCHYHELIKQVLNSYSSQNKVTELQILEPILMVDVLVLDELGVTKPTDWVTDTISHVLNTRYNERRTTILTTNYANSAAVLTSGKDLTALEQARGAMRRETLGDRIGERMLSRLQEMCVVLEMAGPDYRSTEKRARFS